MKSKRAVIYVLIIVFVLPGFAFWGDSVIAQTPTNAPSPSLLTPSPAPISTSSFIIILVIAVVITFILTYWLKPYLDHWRKHYTQRRRQDKENKFQALQKDQSDKITYLQRADRHHDARPSNRVLPTQ